MPRTSFSSVIDTFKKEEETFSPVKLTRQNAMRETLFEAVLDKKEEIKEKLEEAFEDKKEEFLEKIEETKEALPEIIQTLGTKEAFLPNFDDISNIAMVFSVGMVFGLMISYCFSKDLVYLE